MASPFVFTRHSFPAPALLPSSQMQTLAVSRAPTSLRVLGLPERTSPSSDRRAMGAISSSPWTREVSAAHRSRLQYSRMEVAVSGLFLSERTRSRVSSVAIPEPSTFTYFFQYRIAPSSRRRLFGSKEKSVNRMRQFRCVRLSQRDSVSKTRDCDNNRQEDLKSETAGNGSRFEFKIGKALTQNLQRRREYIQIPSDGLQSLEKTDPDANDQGQDLHLSGTELLQPVPPLLQAWEEHRHARKREFPQTFGSRKIIRQERPFRYVCRCSSNDQNDTRLSDTTHDEETEDSVGVQIAISILRFYKREISPLIPASCRYVPTCSEYGIQAFKKYGVGKGFILTAWRLARCNPLGSSGFDPPRWFGEEMPPPS